MDRERVRGALCLNVLCVAWAMACEPQDEVKGPGHKPDAPRLGSNPAALLSTTRVVEMELMLRPAAMAELAREPRDYVKGRFRYGEHVFDEVGVRFKGHRTMRKWHEKPSFKIHFSRHEKGRRFMGLQELVLNNMVQDPTMLRETLGYEIARALEVPAPRTGFVELRVNGERFGLYTLVEPVDELFLKRRFGRPDGLLYEGEYGCDFYPGDVLSMELDEGHDKGRKLIRDLAQAATGPAEALFDDDSVLDVPALQRFVAASALIGDFDGYRHAHNYFAYRDPARERWGLIPWGLDRVLKKRIEPFDSHGLLAKRCFAHDGCRLGYVETLWQASKRFEALELEKRLDALEEVVREASARDLRRPHDDEERAEELERTREFLRTRARELREALPCYDGERERDRDGDGYGCGDCDDSDPHVHPGAEETCNERDDDCSGLADDAPSCPCEQLELDGWTYELCHLPMTWLEAARFCEARGAHLARIEHKKHSRALNEAAEDIDEVEWWLGMHDRRREGHFAWHDATAVGFTYWASGEPDLHTCGQDCIAFKEDAHGKWRDMHCASPRPFICSTPPATGSE